MSRKILLTGGHAATTALATIQALRGNGGDWEISWVGSKRAFEGKSVETLESKILLGEVNYYELTTGRLQRKWTKHTLSSLLRVVLGFFQAVYLVYTIHPNVVLSFGGFVALPVVVAAWIFKVPVVIHEQTTTIGLANKLSLPFASKITLARSESLTHYPGDKSEVIGNPILEYIKAAEAPRKLPKVPTIVVLGGSRGSQIINSVVKRSLASLLTKYKVVHVTGELDFDEFKSINAKRYEVYGILHPEELAKVYSRAHIVISRAGANTVSEVLTLQIPSILVPIPWTRYDEQQKNAELARKSGLARILPQKELTIKRLLEEVDYVHEHWQGMAGSKPIGDARLDREASRRLVKILERWAV